MGKIRNDSRVKNFSLFRVNIIIKVSLIPMVNTVTTGALVSLVTIVQSNHSKERNTGYLDNKVNHNNQQKMVNLVTSLTMVMKIPIGTI
jgi:hypothetical protein